MTGVWALLLLSRLPSLPAEHCSTLTHVGMRHGAKCPRLCVQSWMLISISSITCSNTDCSHSRALSFVTLPPPPPICTWPQMPWANRVKLFGVCVAAGYVGSLVRLAKTFQQWSAKPCWSSDRSSEGWGKGACGWTGLMM